VVGVFHFQLTKKQGLFAIGYETLFWTRVIENEGLNRILFAHLTDIHAKRGGESVNTIGRSEYV
jgi:hypothetical protein